LVALVPFVVHVTRLPEGPEGSRGAARAGLWLGVAFFGVLLHWVAFSIPGRPWLGLSAYGAAVALLALAPALAGLLLHGLATIGGHPPWIAFPLAWTTAEWARGALPGGLAFPWGGSALSLAGSPRWLTLLPVAGELGVALWIGLVNGLLATALVRQRGARVAPVVGGVLAVLAPLTLAVLPQGGGQATGSVRVALIQTAVPVEARRDPASGADAMAAAADRLLARLQPGSVDVVVLPETAFPILLEAPGGARHLEWLRQHAARLRAPLVVGALSRSEGSRTRPLNSLYVVDERGVAGRYDKRRLVPVIERNPLAGSRTLALLGDTSSYEVGSARPLLDVGGVLLGTLICFESAFADLAREQRGGGARLLVNATNDAWFGGGLPGRAARAQHEAHAVLRALESRTPVVRSANGGRSMWIDERGIVTPVAPAGSEGVLVAPVPLAGSIPGGLPLHGAVGPACAAAAALLLLAAARSTRPGGPARAPGGPVSPPPTGRAE
jgi:apolipoprotein N-acyltransferase